MGISIRLITLAVAALQFAAFAQTTYYVNGSCGDDAWSGLSPVCQAPDGPKQTINAAWTASAAGDTVRVAPGVYSGEGNTGINLSDRGRLIRSEAGPLETIIDGQGIAEHAFLGDDGNYPPETRVEGFTITNFTNSAAVIFEGSAGFDRCRFVNNSHPEVGGAVWMSHTQAEFVNCEFIGNSAGDEGGAIWSYVSATPSIINCTFVNNTAPTAGGIYSFMAHIDNCIVRGPGDQFYNIYAPYVTHNNIQGGPLDNGNIDADPLFADPDSGDYRLSPGSPSIDAGSNPAVPDESLTDLAGRPRFVDDPATPDTGIGPPPVVDMGAHEFQATCYPDFNGDDILDIFDYLAFVNAFNAGDPSADCNADAALNLFDFLCFVNAFNQGC
jgi:hypothetical protein